MQQASTDSVVTATPARCCVAHAWLTKAQHEALDLEARRRRIHPDQLLARIASVVIDDDWFAALLDDNEN